jgi:enoyl-CoA hydratase/carnithine racemase
VAKVLYQAAGPVARITINRPEVMNAFDLETAAMLKEHLLAFDSDSNLRVAIVTGAGDKAFSAGADLKKMGTTAYGGGIREIWDHELRERLGQRLHVQKPVIAAVNGFCLAGGLELALGCDIRIASTAASFGAPEARWSILHGFGAMRLPHIVGLSMALDLMLTGERIDAKRAYEVGLVSRLVEPAELMPEAERVASRIAENGPMALRIVKELAWRGLHEPPAALMSYYAAASGLLHQTEDAKEGPKAFVEKRPAKFTGK